MIKTLPTRYPEIGRLRLGEKDGNRPKKLTTWRATSNDELTLRALATIYGGNVEEWKDGEQTYQVTTESDTLEVLLPADPVFTAFEAWTAGGCQRRCDGERCTVPVEGPDGGHLEEQDCVCLDRGWTPGDHKDVKAGACTVNVRLKVVIPAVPGLGIWSMTSHSIYAAMELPSQVELLASMAQRGSVIPAVLAIEQRSEKKPWEKYRRDFIVPVLRVHASLSQLQELAAVDAPAARPALAPAPVVVGGGNSIPPEHRAEPSRPDPSVAERSPAPARKEHSGVFSRAIYMQAKRADLDKDQVHAIVAHVTDYETNSTKELDEREANEVLAVIRRVKDGEVRLVPEGLTFGVEEVTA